MSNSHGSKQGVAELKQKFDGSFTTRLPFINAIRTDLNAAGFYKYWPKGPLASDMIKKRDKTLWSGPNAEVKYLDYSELFDKEEAMAFAIVLARIEEHSIMWSKISHTIKDTQWDKFCSIIHETMSSKTLMNALDTILCIYKIERSIGFVEPTVQRTELKRLNSELRLICGDDQSSIPASIAVVDSLQLKVRTFLDPIALASLNPIMNPTVRHFIELHIAPNLENIASINWDNMNNIFESHLLNSVQLVMAKEADIQAKLKHKETPTAAASNIQVNTGVSSKKTKRAKQALDALAAPQQQSSKKPKKEKIPVADRCPKCVARKRAEGYNDETMFINHKEADCYFPLRQKPATAKVNVTLALIPQSNGLDTTDATVAQIFQVNNYSDIKNELIIDSGANIHLVNIFYRHLLKDMQPFILPIEGIGGVINFSTTHIAKMLFMGELIEVHYNARISKCVFAITLLTATNKFKFIFDENFVICINKINKSTFTAYATDDKLYKLNQTSSILFEQVPTTISMLASVRPTNQYDLWHARLGHVHSNMIEKMSKDPIYIDRGMKITDKSFEVKEKDLCSTCAESKMTKSFSHEQHFRDDRKGRLWYMDVSGPYTVESLVYSDSHGKIRGGNKYLIMFIDSCTRTPFDYYTKNRDENTILAIAIQFNQDVLSSFTMEGDIVFIQSDNGEMASDIVKGYLRKANVFQRFTHPYHPDMNPLAERMFRTIAEMIKCMLRHAGLPDLYWEFASHYSTLILKILPNQTPQGIVREAYFLWTTETFNYKLLRTFGSRTYVLNNISTKDFRSKAEEGIFIGFKSADLPITYEIYLPSKGRTVCSGDVVMTEHVGRPNQERLLPLIDSSKREYTIEDFKYLVNTYHYDHHEACMYKVVRVYVLKGNIVVDRVLFDQANPSKIRRNFDTVYARDAAEYPIVSELGLPIVPSMIENSHLDEHTSVTTRSTQSQIDDTIHADNSEELEPMEQQESTPYVEEIRNPTEPSRKRTKPARGDTQPSRRSLSCLLYTSPSPRD